MGSNGGGKDYHKRKSGGGGSTQATEQDVTNRTPTWENETRTVEGIDPLEVAIGTNGEARLEKMLQNSDISQIRAMMREYQLDPLRMTAGWKRKERIIAHIMEVVYGRTRDGAALRRN